MCVILATSTSSKIITFWEFHRLKYEPVLARKTTFEQNVCYLGDLNIIQNYHILGVSSTEIQTKYSHEHHPKLSHFWEFHRLKYKPSTRTNPHQLLSRMCVIWRPQQNPRLSYFGSFIDLKPEPVLARIQLLSRMCVILATSTSSKIITFWEFHRLKYKPSTRMNIIQNYHIFGSFID